MLAHLLNAFGLNADKSVVEKLTSGLINQTWKVTANEKEYILQQINKNVFRSPFDIADNIEKLDNYLHKVSPDYLFVSSIEAKTGQYLIEYDGEYFRLMPFVPCSHTIDTVNSKNQAYEAAKQFGKFTSILSSFDTSSLKYTLPNFHNLSLRFEQFEQAYNRATNEIISLAESEIQEAFQYKHIVDTYDSIISDKLIPLRVVHHDTKISNVLFNENDKGLCVIDLDTVMPGYFISDVGDMMRTYLSPANEEERDFSKITVREEYFEALVDGYLSEMGRVLTPEEKDLIIYSGKFMIYMQAIRFLTDFLNGDIYYTTSYPKQNLNRARNQFVLLNNYLEAEGSFQNIVNKLVY